MTPFLQLILLLAILLFAAKTAGYLSTTLNQPSVLGELLIGLVVGPSILDLANIPWFESHLVGEIITELAEIGVLFLMFVAGLELHFNELLHNSRVSAAAGFLGVLVPVGLGWGTGLLFNLSQKESIFLGLALGATSVSISAQTLMELKVLRSRVGLGLLGAAVFDDVLVILLLSIFLAFAPGEAGIGAVLLVFIRMVIFLVLSLAVGIWILPAIVRKVARLPISQGVLTLALVIMFLYGVSAELVGGMAAITGTFLAGLMFARSPEKERLERGVNALAYGFFVPIFFIHIGMSVNLREFDLSFFWFFVIVLGVAITGKLIGAGLGARLMGMSPRDSIRLGAGMVSRGEVGLIIASLGLAEGLLDGSIFSVVVGIVLISTLITPPLLRALFKEQKSIADETT